MPLSISPNFLQCSARHRGSRSYWVVRRLHMLLQGLNAVSKEGGTSKKLRRCRPTEAIQCRNPSAEVSSTTRILPSQTPHISDQKSMSLCESQKYHCVVCCPPGSTEDPHHGQSQLCGMKISNRLTSPESMMGCPSNRIRNLGTETPGVVLIWPESWPSLICVGSMLCSQLFVQSDDELNQTPRSKTR